jgi:hypothetical protein
MLETEFSRFLGTVGYLQVLVEVTIYLNQGYEDRGVAYAGSLSWPQRYPSLYMLKAFLWGLEYLWGDLFFN